MNVAMILAAGGGSRFGGDTPKQYVKVLGKPVLVYTMEQFEASPDIDAICVVCKPEYAAYVRELGEQYGISKLRWVTDGGQQCQDSIRSGVYALREHMADDDILMMHLAVSPLVARETIHDAIALCREKGCSFTMFPILICMAKKVGENWTNENAFKEDYLELNVPWTFNYGKVYDLYRKADAMNVETTARDYTLNLWMAMGNKAYYFRGNDAGRLKITTPNDLDMFKAYMLVQKMKEEEN